MLPKKRLSALLSLPRDRTILLACMVISLVFWLLVKLTGRYTAEKEVNLKVELPADRAFSQGPLPPVQVDVEGRGWDLLFSYFTGRDTLQYDLRSEDSDGLTTSRLQNDIYAYFASEALTVQNVLDGDLDLQLEETLQRSIPVRLEDTLTFAPGYQLVGPVRLRPDSIVVRGPVSAVEALEVWPTQPLLLRNIKASQAIDLGLRRPGAGIQVEPDRVTAEIEVEQLTEKSLFVGLQVHHAPAQDSLRYFPQRVKVRCIVGLSKYPEVDSSDFTLVADLLGVSIEAGQNTVPIRLTKQPDFVRNVNFSPDVARFYIVERDSLGLEQ